MKTIKLLLAAATLTAAVLTPALQAQDDNAERPAGEGRRGPGGPGGAGGRGQMSPEARVEQLDRALQLTAEQKTKIAGIYAKARDEMEALSPDERREKGRELMQATQRQVRAALTAEQQAKFDELRPGMGRGEGRGQGQGKGGDGGERKRKKDQ